MRDDKNISADEQLGIPTDDIPEEVGSVKVADEVISIVAGLAAIEVPGIADMSGGIRGGINDMLGKQNFSKGIKVTPNGKTVVIDVYVYIKYGYSIPDVAIALQEKVKEAVENMTGYEVTSVNIMVEGIRRKERVNIDEEPEPENAAEDEEEKVAKKAEAMMQDDEEEKLAKKAEAMMQDDEEEKLAKKAEAMMKDDEIAKAEQAEDKNNEHT